MNRYHLIKAKIAVNTEKEGLIIKLTSLTFGDSITLEIDEGFLTFIRQTEKWLSDHGFVVVGYGDDGNFDSFTFITETFKRLKES